MIIVAVALYISADSANAQDFKIAVENSKDGKLSLINFVGDLPIEGYNGKEIIITSMGEPVTTPDRAKGLKPVYSAGTDNTGMGLSVDKNGNQVTVTCLLPFTRNGDFKIKVPENLAIKYESSCERQGDVSVQGIKNEIEIKTCHSINLKEVSGPLVLSTIAGNIDVVFSGQIAGEPSSISSISGEVDVTLPGQTGTNLELKSISGNIYSDFDFPQTDKKDLKQIGGNNLNYKLNGGGFGLNLVTVSGNVYLRKGK